MSPPLTGSSQYMVARLEGSMTGVALVKHKDNQMRPIREDSEQFQDDLDWNAPTYSRGMFRGWSLDIVAIFRVRHEDLQQPITHGGLGDIGTITVQSARDTHLCQIDAPVLEPYASPLSPRPHVALADILEASVCDVRDVRECAEVVRLARFPVY